MAAEEVGEVREVEETDGATEVGEATEVTGAKEAAGMVAQAGVDIEIEVVGTEPATLDATVTRYPVAPGYRVNVRSGPGTHYSVVRVLPYDARVPIYCQKAGQSVSGPYGTSTLWDNIGNGQFVSDTYVRTGSDGYVAPHCA